MTLSGFLDSIGIEVETDLLDRDSMEKLLKEREVLSWFKLDHDASIETPATAGPSGSFLLDKKLLGRRGSKTTLGIELVSKPMGREELPSVLRKLMTGLRCGGDSERSKRSSIHVHIGYSSKFEYVRRAVKLFLNIEPLFYHLAGMGYEFRGNTNRSIYCRPLYLKNGPPVVYAENDRYYVLFDPKELAKAKDVIQFWNIMGVDSSRAQKYHPARYLGLNVMSTLLHGTLEFRYFNKTLDHNKIVAVSYLCQMISEMIVKMSDSEADNFPFSDDSFRTLQQLADFSQRKELIYTVPPTYFSILNLILDSTTKPKIEDVPVKTHLIGRYTLPAYYLDSSILCTRTLIKKSEALDSGFTDIHNISSSFDEMDNIA